MDLNKSKMKNIKAYLQLEPNFPGVATPQRSEWIVYIISYAYNPFTAPWGGKLLKCDCRAGAEGVILLYVGHLQLISTLKIGADCCQLCQYKLTKHNLT